MIEQERIPPSDGVERLRPEEVPPVRVALVPFRMTSAPEAKSAEFADDLADDTIELALTDEDLRALSRAAEEEHVDTSPGESALIGTGVSLRAQRMRFRRWLPALALSVSGVGIAVALGVVAHHTFAVTTTAPLVAERSADLQDSPIQFSNPFDASETFEFPAGTSEEQARQSVAAILLQRARDRQVADAGKSNRPMPGAPDHRARIAQNSGPRRT